MNRISSDMLYFFDSWLIPKISEEYKISEETAMKNFIYSETYNMLFDYSTKLFIESPLVIFDMYKAEKEKGNPRESSYIKGDAYV
ncbi:MAG: hypothetical protein LBC87_12485 [Fibromonadaceae bacterium]|jgi:hypothetical protein|nr:hypothetical protein [Fibromonadaceae bacterium]